MADEQDYYEQEKRNAEAFKAMVKAGRPDIWLLMDALDETGVNPVVVWKVIKQLDNVANTTKYGVVRIEIENNTVRFVRGETADKVNEPILKVTPQEPPVPELVKPGLPKSMRDLR